MFLPHETTKQQTKPEKTAVQSIILPTMAPTPEIVKGIPASFFVTPDKLQIATDAGQVALISGKETFVLFGKESKLNYSGQEIKDVPVSMASLSPDKSKVLIAVENILSKPFMFYTDIKADEHVAFKPIGGEDTYVWSPDSRYLLYAVGGDCGPANRQLYVFDTKENKNYSYTNTIPGFQETDTRTVVYDNLLWSDDSNTIKFHYKVLTMNGCGTTTTIKQGNSALPLTAGKIEER